MKFSKVMMILGLVLSFSTGVWHFFIPYMFEWYSYIPEAPRNIIVSVDWINYLFSLLLAGFSLILIFLMKEIFRKEKASIMFYIFLVFVWLNRIVITIVHPWAYDTMFYVQLISFVFIFTILLIPLLSIIRKR